MNTIIIYSSKYGSAEDCARSLKSGMDSPVSLIDINSIPPEQIIVKDFDTVIFGSSIYVGKIPKKLQVFCNENINMLKKKKVGIFLCCAIPAEINEYLSANFPAALLEHAAVIKNFGGEARMDKMKAVDKIIMKAATKGGYKNLKISRENLEAFIREICDEPGR